MSDIRELYEEKMEASWNRKENVKNFHAERELLVTITLAEYRELIQEVATKKDDIDRANNMRWKVENENSDLRKKIAKLVKENEDGTEE